MVCVLTLQSVSQMSVRVLQTEESIRDLILYQREKLLHEDIDAMSMLPQTVIPRDLENIPDEERRAVIRALSWVMDDENILQRQQ